MLDDVFIAKINGNMGSLDWVGLLEGGVGSDIATDIGVSPSGEVFISVDIQILPYHLGKISMLASAISDSFIVKTDSTGNVSCL